MKIDSESKFAYKYTVNKIMHPAQNIFDIYDINTSKKVGTLVCHKTELPLRPNCNNSVLAIDFLEVSSKNKGIGTKILKFAEEYSKHIGCNGFLIVKADGSFTPQRIPHIFYRKFGFSTFDKRTDIKLDKFIKENRSATKKDFPCLIMHYPPKTPKSTKFIKKIVKIIERIKQSFSMTACKL
ncbi:GNAT family N-acetyltransferase [bacterium]|nr:GNAT family N-acetyltransferase [bacterium]